VFVGTRRRRSGEMSSTHASRVRCKTCSRWRERKPALREGCTRTRAVIKCRFRGTVSASIPSRCSTNTRHDRLLQTVSRSARDSDYAEQGGPGPIGACTARLIGHRHRGAGACAGTRPDPNGRAAAKRSRKHRPFRQVAVGHAADGDSPLILADMRRCGSVAACHTSRPPWTNPGRKKGRVSPGSGRYRRDIIVTTGLYEAIKAMQEQYRAGLWETRFRNVAA